MALFTQNEDIKCSCGNTTFTEDEMIRVMKKPMKSTLTETVVYEKVVVGNYLKCTKCGAFMTNILKTSKET